MHDNFLEYFYNDKIEAILQLESLRKMGDYADSGMYFCNGSWLVWVELS